jgi:deoxyribonucleoside regulator
MSATEVLSREEKERISLMVDIASMYYYEGMTQEEIAERLGITRLRVNKLLQEARKQGIVRIEVVNPIANSGELASKLAALYGLQRVEVVPVLGEESMIASALGKAAARLLPDLLRPGNSVGIGWGTSVFEVVNAMTDDHVFNVTYVPLIGGMGEVGAHFQINEFARILAEKTASRWRALYVPFLVEKVETKRALLSDASIQRAVAMWSQLDVAVVGIGVSISKSPLLLSSHFSNAHLVQLERQGVVGDICSRFFDENGQPCQWDVDDRLIGVSLEELKHTKTVIAVAGGLMKQRAIRAALRQGIVDVLVIDEDTANALIKDELRREVR